MKFNKTQLAVFGLLFLACTIRAEVFSLAPFSKKGGAGIEASKALGGLKLWSEPIIVNGLKTGMQLTLMDRGFDEIIIFFKKKYPNAVFRANKDAVLIEIKHPDGSLERLYLVNTRGAYPIIQFSMIFPQGLPKDLVWPEELPIPPSATLTSTILLPERNVVYGSFSTKLPKEAAQSVVWAKLVTDGWQDLKQGVFIKKEPFSIIMTSFSDEENGNTKGFVLKRNLGR